MKLTRGTQPLARLRNRAFSLVDAIFAMAMAAVMFAALYAGLAYGFKVIRMARENTRATQIMLEHMEILRLYRWEQLTNINFFPTDKFTVPYYAVGGTNTSLLYTGQVSVTVPQISGGPGFGPNYTQDMRKVTIRLDWCPMGGTNRTRTMTTYVTRNGLQQYVF